MSIQRWEHRRLRQLQKDSDRAMLKSAVFSRGTPKGARTPRCLDPNQRDHELGEALLTLLIAISRYGNNEKVARPTPARLATMEELAVLIVNGVAARLRKIAGEQAEARFRARVSGTSK
jgi:hypothetical protein